MAKSNTLSLELNETLFFQKHYQIDDMVSISIDPDISIQSFNDYVSIRGVVVLEGEYNKLTDSQGQLQRDDNDNQVPAQNFVRVKEGSDQTIHFNHHFPIDISIPLDRIKSLDEVTVGVTSFDYTLIDPAQLQIISTLNINGVNKEKVKKQRIEDKQTETTNFSADDVLPFKTTHQKSTQSSNLQSEEPLEKNVKKAADELKTESKKISKQLKSSEQKEFPINEDEVKDDKNLKQSSIKTIDTKHVSASQSAETTVRSPLKQDDSHQSISDKTSKSDILESVENISQTTEGIKVEEQPAIDDELTGKDVPLQDITYLADIFESDEENKSYQMRLCIVQRDDTLHSIAERYEVPTQQIIHLNNLDDDQVLDGQLLLIPTEDG